MLIIISWILVIITLLVMAFILIRKFPALAILDVANIPEEKAAKFKDKLIQERVKRDVSRWTGLFGRLYLFTTKRLLTFIRSGQARLKKIRNANLSIWKIPGRDKDKKIQELFREAEELLKKEKADVAEEKLVEIASLDQKNLAAFFTLGNLYQRQKKWPEARQTFEYALKLARHHPGLAGGGVSVTPQEIYFSLATVAKEVGELDLALDHIREALEIEPNSPRYLDLILDLSIMGKDQALAQESWNKLAAANPENNKLSERLAEIEKMGEQ